MNMYIDAIKIKIGVSVQKLSFNTIMLNTLTVIDFQIIQVILYYNRCRRFFLCVPEHRPVSY